MTKYLSSEGFRHSVNPATKCHAYTGMLTVGGERYCLQLRYSEGIYGFPEAYLAEWKSDSLLRETLQLRNINSDGKICYVDESQTWWDPHEAVGMTVAALSDISLVISRNQASEWQGAEFLRDFDGYWQAQKQLYRAADAQGGNAYQALGHGEQDWLVPVADTPQWLASADPAGMWLPIQLKTLPQPPVHCWPPKSVSEFAQWVGQDNLVKMLQCHSQAGRGAKSKRGKGRSREVSILVSLLLCWPGKAGHSEPRVGVQFALNSTVLKYIKQGRYKFAADLLSGSNDLIQRFCIVNATPAFIHGRNTPEGYRTLKNHRVVLVGAGTIGGFLASQLCSMGAGLGPRGELHLIDSDRLKPENIARHLLGIGEVGKHKATALRDHLISKYPYLKVESHPSSVWHCQEVIGRATLVINATGSLSAGIGLEDIRSQRSVAVPILHSWIEGHGLACTAFFSTGNSGDACLRCLVQSRPEGYRYRCKIAKTEAYAEPVFQGCHQSYFPYLVTASNAAAGQAMTMISDWLNEQLELTLQYNILRPSLVENRPSSTPKQDAKCSICSKKQ